jgi:spore coat polysaccharide biosynthesis protein SpsF
MKAAIITQARMTSTRLPGKVLMEVSGHPMLYYHIQRLKSAELPIVVATTINETDDPIAQWCIDNDLPYFRGDEQNVLSRYFGAANQFQADIIVRVTSDCPLIDGTLIAEGVAQYLHEGNEKAFMSNSLSQTYPRGLDFAIFSKQMLDIAMSKAHTQHQLEHVTPYFRTQPEVFPPMRFEQTSDDSDIRITLDTKEDFTLINKLIESFSAHQLRYSEIIQLFRSNPELLEINRHVVQK